MLLGTTHDAVLLEYKAQEKEWFKMRLENQFKCAFYRIHKNFLFMLSWSYYLIGILGS